MIKEWKQGLQLWKYSYSYHKKDGDRVMPFIFGGLGILFLLLGMHSSYCILLSAIYLIMAPTIPSRMSYSLLYSNMIGASGKRKLLDVVLPNIWMVCGTLLGYVVLAAGTFILGSISPEMQGEYAIVLVQAAVLLGLVVIFWGISSKYFWQGVLVLVLVASPLYILGILWENNLEKSGEEPISLVTALLFFLIVLLVSLCISCLLRALFYKKELVRGQVGKEMLKSM